MEIVLQCVHYWSTTVWMVPTPICIVCTLEVSFFCADRLWNVMLQINSDASFSIICVYKFTHGHPFGSKQMRSQCGQCSGERSLSSLIVRCPKDVRCLVLFRGISMRFSSRLRLKLAKTSLSVLQLNQSLKASPQKWSYRTRFPSMVVKCAGQWFL